MRIDIPVYDIIQDLSRTYKTSVRKITNAVERGIKLGVIDLAEIMKIKCQEYVAEEGLGDSTLANTITVTNVGGACIIDVNSEYAIYVEYGTGIVGQASPHPEPWEYDINGHGEDGWVYPKKGGGFGRTRGQRSHPFLYKTHKYGVENANRIIINSIEKEVAKAYNWR